MGRWRRYSDATTIKDALQAVGTPSDMRDDFEKGLMVIENFQTPEPVRGSGNMRHMASLRFTFHTVKCRFRDCLSSYASAFVRGLPCGDKDRAKVANSCFGVKFQKRASTSSVFRNFTRNFRILRKKIVVAYF